MKKKKIIAFTLTAILMFILVAWGKEALVISPYAKLVDLEHYITTSIGLNNTDSESISVQEPDKVESTESKKDNLVTRHTIRVSGEHITYDGVTVYSIDQLKIIVNEKYVMDLGAIKLIDDYAEAHVYKAVLGVLEEYAKDRHLKYVESQ